MSDRKLDPAIVVAPPEAEPEYVQFIRKVRALITDPLDWNKDAYYEDHEWGRSHCLLGAINVTAGRHPDCVPPLDILTMQDGEHKALDAILTAIALRPDYMGEYPIVKVDVFNDTSEHKDVLDMLDSAIELELEKWRAHRG